MSGYQTIFAAVGSLIGIISYIPYFRDILRGATKPHPFSWFVWGLIDAVVFVAQSIKGGGPGAWITGMTTLACFAIAALALQRGEKVITLVDWFCFAAALVAIVLWRLTSEPLTAVIIVTAADLIMYIPTIRKSYWKPHEETLTTWTLNTIKWALSIWSLDTISWTTALFPAAIVPVNILFVSMLLIRRKQLSKS